jgi:CheY-like chemotaxis protein
MMPGMDGFALAEAILSPRDGKGHGPMPVVMMLSSAGQAGDAARCRALGVASYLTKPIRQSHLLDSIMDSLGARAGGPAIESRLGDNTPSRLAGERGGQGRRILLAEDNEVNQRLAVRILEKRGYAVTVANNGREALAALEPLPTSGPGTRPGRVGAREAGGPFDLVLMDVQMPEMGGFEATAAIREKEQGTGNHLPIVAMTAHAMKGDRERCLEAGMDGYVTKPIQPQVLFDTIEALMPAQKEPEPGEVAGAGARPSPLHGDTASDGAGSEPILDREQVMKRVAGDVELLKELIDIFLEECPPLLAAIREAIAGQDGEALEQAAHKLKGAVGNFSAPAAAEAALRLEVMGRERDLAGADAAYADLESGIERLKPALAALAGGAG